MGWELRERKNGKGILVNHRHHQIGTGLLDADSVRYNSFANSPLLILHFLQYSNSYYISLLKENN